MSSPAASAIKTESLTPAVPNNGRALVLILGALTAIAPLAIDMYLPALPEIARNLGIEVGEVQLTLSVFMIGMAVGQAFYGPIADRWGRRGPLLVGMAVFSLAAVGCACAQSMKSLLIWRLVMALGGSASMVIPRAVVRDLFAEKDSARVYSVLMLILGVSPILAPTLGGQMLGLTGWRGIFWVLGAVGVACAAAVAWGLPESLPREQRVTTGGVGRVLRTYGELLANRRFLGAVIAAGCTMGSLFAYLTASPFVFIELHHLTPQQYAMVFGFNAIGLVAASQINLWLVGRYSLWQVLSGAFIANVISGLLLVLCVATGWGGLAAIIGLIFVSMSAAGVIFPNIAALAMAPFGAVAGSASALLGVFQFGVGALSGALVGVFQSGTAMPMAVGLAICATVGWVVLRTMAGR
jgi:DHA1 family bicyclomycin/chloramphenicol resistance-like MFS transporter